MVNTNAATVSSPRGVLHFYPGQKRLIWVVRGKAVLKAEAWGGEEVKDGVNFGKIMRPHRTTPGRYVVHSYGPYKTKTWPMARIRWGSPLKVEGVQPFKYVLYQTGTTHRSWRRVDSLIPSVSFAQLQIYYKQLYGDSGRYDPDGDGIPDRWVFNEFGPKAVRYFRDQNDNGVLDGDEHLMGEMLHTIPLNEAEDARGMPMKYTLSHGCIHVSPDDRDRLHRAGAFRPGTTFIVHKYEERVPVVPQARVQLPEAPEPPTETRVSRLMPEKTFLDFVVLDVEGKPLAGRRYKLEMPDGSVETGTLGSDAHIDVRNIEPGTARFTLLPDEMAAAAAPAAAEEPDEAEPAEEVAADEDLLPDALALDLVGFRLIDDDDQPVAGHAVEFTLADGSIRQAVTDGDGKIFLSGVAPGDCQATIEGVGDGDLRTV